MIRLFLVLLLSLGFLAHAEARTWKIAVDGSGDAPTIQDGIDDASVGDTLHVGPGTYFENINFGGKDLSLIGTGGAHFTTIDGSNQEDSVVIFSGGESRACLLQGFTITGGTGNRDLGLPKGGGILCLIASPTIRKNIISGNTALPRGAGGGIRVGVIPDSPPSPLIEENLFEDNVAAVVGGAISLQHCEAIVRKNKFYRNRILDGDGGAIFQQQIRPGEVIIEENEFWENRANDHGGAIHVDHIGPGAGPTTIRGNLLVRNVGDGIGGGDTGSGGGIYVFTSTRFSSSEVAITNNTIVFNAGGGESPCSGGGITFRNGLNLRIENNIIAFNYGCGVVCRDQNTVCGNVGADVLGPNVIWQNSEGNVGNEMSHYPPEWFDASMIVDPRFCGAQVDIFTLAQNTPAIVNGIVMGALPAFGCGPVTGIEPTSWGKIKRSFGP